MNGHKTCLGLCRVENPIPNGLEPSGKPILDGGQCRRLKAYNFLITQMNLHLGRIPNSHENFLSLTYE